MSDHTDRPTDDDVQGHGLRRAYTEDADQPADDVEGHGIRRSFTEETETSVIRGRDATAGLADDPDDDVTGHLSGSLGAQKRDEGA